MRLGEERASKIYVCRVRRDKLSGRTHVDIAPWRPQAKATFQRENFGTIVSWYSVVKSYYYRLLPWLQSIQLEEDIGLYLEDVSLVFSLHLLSQLLRVTSSLLALCSTNITKGSEED